MWKQLMSGEYAQSGAENCFGLNNVIFIAGLLLLQTAQCEEHVFIEQEDFQA